MESSGIYFPSDIIFEILSRASLQTVSKCRLLSKEINSLTYESNFMNLHHHKTNTVRGFFIQGMKYNKYYSAFVSTDDDNRNSISNLSLDFLSPDDHHHHVEIVASTKQGILLCINQTPRIPRYVVCKPGTGDCQVIPNPKTRYHTQNIGMVVLRSSPLRFKIVRFSRPKYGNGINLYGPRCEVFDSDFWSWKQLDSIDLPDHTILNNEPTVSACGALHWCTSKNNIFAYNVEKETWRFLELPKPVHDKTDTSISYKYCIQLVDYEGKLALISMEIDRHVMELWVLTNYKQNIWTKRHSISIEAQTRNEPYSFPAALYNADVVLMKWWCYSMTFYKFKDGNSKRVKLQFEPREIFPFESDLEPTNLMGTHKKDQPQYRRSTIRRQQISNDESMNSSKTETEALGPSFGLEL